MKRIILVKALSQENSSISTTGRTFTMTHQDVQRTHDLAHFVEDNNLIPDNIISGSADSVIFTSFLFARELNVDLFKINKVVYDNEGVLKPLETIATQQHNCKSILLVVNEVLFHEILGHFIFKINEVDLFSQQMLFLNFSCDNWPETLYSQPQIIPGTQNKTISEKKDIA